MCLRARSATHRNVWLYLSVLYAPTRLAFVEAENFVLYMWAPGAREPVVQPAALGIVAILREASFCFGEGR